MARYSRTGFEAAAVSAFAVATAARLPSQHREVTLRFGHPYAVVARHHGRVRTGRPVARAAGVLRLGQRARGRGAGFRPGREAVSTAYPVSLKQILAIKSPPGRAVQTLILFATPLVEILR